MTHASGLGHTQRKGTVGDLLRGALPAFTSTATAAGLDDAVRHGLGDYDRDQYQRALPPTEAVEPGSAAANFQTWRNSRNGEVQTS